MTIGTRHDPARFRQSGPAGARVGAAVVTCRLGGDGAASYLGIATPNQRRINATVQSIASMLASFDIGMVLKKRNSTW